MKNIAYYYQGNQDYIERLKQYNLVILIDDEKYIDELLKYNVLIRPIKNDKSIYDILISETDNVGKINARKKVVIGKGNKRRLQYIDKFNIDEIFKEKQINDNIKFSIIIPNYNNGEWIDKTIESVLSQTYQDWEMYIIDDMSTDNSIEVINKYKDKRITLIENEIKLYNGGSRNVGILKARKSNPDGYLLFIDSDDWWSNKDFLNDLNKFIVDEDIITFEYQWYINNQVKPATHFYYQNKDELFMTIGCLCAIWCKCVKTELMPLFEFNTLMEDRNHHYRLINRINTFSHFDKYQPYVWNKMNKKSVSTSTKQKYDSQLQSIIEWDHCAYRHIAGMLDLLNELDNQKWKDFIQKKINACKNDISNGIYQQF